MRNIYYNHPRTWKGYKCVQRSAKPINDIREVYLIERANGSSIPKTTKAVAKQAGVCGPILAGGGAILGTVLIPILGGGLIGAIGGYRLGHSIDKGMKKSFDYLWKCVKTYK